MKRIYEAILAVFPLVVQKLTASACKINIVACPTSIIMAYLSPYSKAQVSDNRTSAHAESPLLSKHSAVITSCHFLLSSDLIR